MRLSETGPRRRHSVPARRRRQLPAFLLLASLQAAWPGIGRAQVVQTATDCTPDRPAATRLLVTATGAHSIAGNVTFALYGAQPARFLAHHGALQHVRVMLTSRTATACFAVSGPGTYAIAVYHDENNNHKFDRTLLGLPAEGYGFSNDAPALVGLPSFSDARFTAGPGDTVLRIRLRY